MCSSHCCTTQGVLNILLGLKKEVLCRQAANDCYYITPTRQAASKPLFSMLNLIFMNLGLTFTFEIPSMFWSACIIVPDCSCYIYLLNILPFLVHREININTYEFGAS